MKNKKHKKHSSALGCAISFFVVLVTLSVMSFNIYMRPSVSQSEKRNLAQFPEFTWDALFSGSYFDDISFWYSDTFPGREGWLRFYDRVEELHGHSNIALGGDLITSDKIPVDTPQQSPSANIPAEEAEISAPSEDDFSVEESVSEESIEAEEETVKAGVEIGPNEEILFSSVIQIGDTVYHYFGFNQFFSDQFIDTVNKFASDVKDEDVRVITCLIPSSVGIMFDKEYMEMLQCADQAAAIDYIADGLEEGIISVDMYEKLLQHRDEYLFYRTDHHWSALGAYYGYVSLCETLGKEAAPLSDFEELDMGTYTGSLFWNAPNSSKLKKDNVYAYNPPGDITMTISNSAGYSSESPLIMDKSKDAENTKYVSFLGGDYPLCTVVNDSIQDDSSCVVVKDSFGNPVIPFLTQNYHTVYAIDYRTYRSLSMQEFVRQHDVDDFIFMPMLGMAQESGALSCLRYICQY